CGGVVGGGGVVRGGGWCGLGILRGKAEGVNQRLLPLLPWCVGIRREVCDGLGVLQELLRRLAEPVEVGPPGGSSLAPVILEELAGDPSWLARLRAGHELSPQLLAGIERFGGLG